ncbi:MAG: hypothetical protein ACREM3_30630, partial [Candidatus Rokuibacteriota bacterium]
MSQVLFWYTERIRLFLFPQQSGHDHQKRLATDSSPDRNLQFDYIADLRERFRRRLPIISVDTKKRE